MGKFSSSSTYRRFVVSFAILISIGKGSEASCYFPAAFQGEYVTQSIMSGLPTISYSTLAVLSDSIPVWGTCHRRIGNNVILMDDTGGLTCYKCFNLVLRSSNVLQIHTAGLDKCYTTEERAMADCPSDMMIREQRAREIMLYRTKGFMGEPAVSPTYCPINGAYQFTYSVKDGTECSAYTSDISDCPYGYGFNLKFNGCSFGDMDMAFHCLGDWEGHDGNKYVALMDTQAFQDEFRPRYRCAMYQEDEYTGAIKFALSSDSTCTNQLRSPTEGYEVLHMRPKIQQKAWPALISQDSCQLPEWTQGKWEFLHIQGGTVLLKDNRNFKTYSAKCIQQKDEEKYLIYARSHCGEEHYKCVWFKNRGMNAIEFQVGVYTSLHHNESLCDEENFLDRTWTTQGRTEVENPTPYPIIGEYTGVIPDTDGLCAKLYSDCNNPEIMFYTIFNCFNRSEVYEEREYRCLGQWKEDNLIYTYTERRDQIGYECFVGLITQKGDIFLKEAGNNCERGQEPLKYGMRLTQVSKCYSNPRIRTSPPPKRPKATALPRWRERELNNYIDSSAPQMKSPFNIFLVLSCLILSIFR